MENTVLMPLAIDSLYEEEDGLDESNFDEDSLDDEEGECNMRVAYQQVIMDCVSGNTCPRCGQHEVTEPAIKLCSPCQWVIGKIEGYT